MISLSFIVYWPKRIAERMETPYHKFITSTCSNLIFLVLIILSINLPQEDYKYIGFGVVDMLLILWVIGLTLRQIKLLWRKKGYCKQCSCDFLHWKFSHYLLSKDLFDWLILLSFWIWISLQIGGTIWNNYSGELTRIMWPPNHPLLIGEAFFALGTLLSFIRLISIFQTNRSLGMLQMLLKLMVWDTFKFIGIFYIILTSFALATTSLYSHYSESVQMVKGQSIEQPNTKFVR